MRMLLNISLLLSFAFVSPMAASEISSMRTLKIAVESYNTGLEYRNKGWDYEEKSSAAKGEKEAKKYNDLAEKQFKKAIKKFRAATSKKPDFFQAYSSLGYAYRKTADFTNALDAYNKAIEIKPDYPQAIEGRAEVHLRFNQVDDAKSAYLLLFTEHSNDLRFADLLIEAMWTWLEGVEIDSEIITQNMIDNFAAWLNDRQQIADRAISQL